MEIKKIVELMANPESLELQDPNKLVLLNGYISEFIDDYKQAVYEQNIKVSEEWQKVRSQMDCTSDKMANERQQGMPEHRELFRLERLIDRLQHFRSDNNKKYELIVHQRFHKTAYK